MAFLKVKNRAVSTLASGISDSDLSLTVATGEGALFPSTYPFHITIEDEILECTNRSTDVLTVTREAEGTTAAAHTAGKAVKLQITAGVIEQIETDFLTHAPRHDIDGDDAIVWRDLDKLFHLVTANRFFFDCFLTYDNMEKYEFGTGAVSQALNITYVHAPALNDAARENYNSQALGFYVGRKYAYYINVGSLANGLGFIGAIKTTKLTNSQTDSDLTDQHIGVWFDAGTVYASYSDGTTQTKQEMAGVSGAGWLRIEPYSDRIEFYWNDILKTTITVAVSQNYGYVQMYVLRTAGATGEVYLYLYNVLKVGA